MNSEKIERKFNELFKATPVLYRSPGRINIIGEHTDYNDGFVMPAAIDKEVVLAIRFSESDKIRMYAYDLGEYCETDSSKLKQDPKKWPDYFSGVVDQLIKDGNKVHGFDLVFGSDIPIGAGLSSSAAIECGLIFAINDQLGFNLNKGSLAALAQRAEQEFVGLNCGIMDQFANLFGKEGQVIKLDCRSLEYKYFPLNIPEYEIILCDSRVKHSLASSEYNTRRKECEEGIRILGKNIDSVKSLRDINIDELFKLKDQFTPTIFKRCQYVVEEIARVEAACIDLEQGDIKALGKKMYETHSGLSKLYEVSCGELDYLVDIAERSDVTGARMMGGGFGGCTINMVIKGEIDHFIENVRSKYEKKFKSEPYIYRVGVRDGTSRLL